MESSAVEAYLVGREPRGDAVSARRPVGFPRLRRFGRSIVALVPPVLMVVLALGVFDPWLLALASRLQSVALVPLGAKASSSTCSCGPQFAEDLDR